MGEISVNLQCPKCRISPCVSDDSDDTSMVHCPKCGTNFGTLASVKAMAMSAAKDKAKDALVEAFKGRKGWKLTRK